MVSQNDNNDEVSIAVPEDEQHRTGTTIPTASSSSADEDLTKKRSSSTQFSDEMRMKEQEEEEEEVMSTATLSWTSSTVSLSPLNPPFGRFEVLYLDDDFRAIRTYQNFVACNRRITQPEDEWF